MYLCLHWHLFNFKCTVCISSLSVFKSCYTKEGLQKRSEQVTSVILYLFIHLLCTLNRWFSETTESTLPEEGPKEDRYLRVSSSDKQHCYLVATFQFYTGRGHCDLLRLSTEWPPHFTLQVNVAILPQTSTQGNCSLPLLPSTAPLCPLLSRVCLALTMKTFTSRKETQVSNAIYVSLWVYLTSSISSSRM